MNPNPNFDELQPGVREIVRAMRAADFPTTDSGDGSAHAAGMGGSRPYVHVDLAYASRGAAISEAERLLAWSRNNPLVPFRAAVEVSWRAGTSSALVHFYDEDAAYAASQDEPQESRLPHAANPPLDTSYAQCPCKHWQLDLLSHCWERR